MSDLRLKKKKDKGRVCVVTVTQYSRLKYLNIVKRQLCRQTFPVTEWVLVNGSRNEDDHDRLEKTILDVNFIPSDSKFKLKYVPTKNEELKTIGHFRNMCNDNVSSDIDYIVCFDDDDYYPENKVEIIIKAFRNDSKKRLLAGTCNHYVFCPDTLIMYQFSLFQANHSINNCLSYRYDFIKDKITHRYDDHAAFGEEESFTNKFTIPMISIDPKHAVVQMCHNSNTFDKRTILWNNIIMERSKRYCFPTNFKLSDLIHDQEVLDLYQDIFGERTYSEYDVVIYCGHLSIEWSPEEQSLGGSEHAVVELARLFAKKGLKVQVYGNFPFNRETHEGVDYVKWVFFKLRSKYKNLILWRLYGMLPILDLNFLHADNLIIDLHDNVKDSYTKIIDNLDKINKVMFKSRFHYTSFRFFTDNQSLPSDKICIVPNGVRVETFQIENENNVPLREKYRICYTSAYTRGLIPFLKHTWPILKRLEPKMEIHVMYGIPAIDNKEFIEELKTLLSQEGVIDHGRVSKQEVAIEKHTSNLHVYFTSNIEEIDCIAVKESLVAGCVPVLSRHNVFSEREGIHVDLDPNDGKSYLLLAKEIINIINNPELDKVRKELKNSPTIKDWDQISDEWIEVFQ
jgi:hypothetical protein